MPKPPPLQAFDDLKFITAYFLAGCSPPFWLFVEFSQEPAKELALILLVPEFEDIAQAIFDPGKGRRRKPARHGRKRKRRIGFPSADDMIGQRVRGKLNPGNVLNIGLFRRAFPILNIYEGINFAAAVIEGTTDIGYEALWGILEADPNHCREFRRLSKTADWKATVGGVGPWLQPVNINTVVFNSGFSNTDTACRNRFGPYQVNFSCWAVNNRTDVSTEGRIVLENTTTGERFEGTEYELQPGESKFLQVSGGFGIDEWCAWGFNVDHHFIDVYQRDILAFETQNLGWS